MDRLVIDFAKHRSRCGGKRKQDELTVDGLTADELTADELTADVLIGVPVSLGLDTGPQSSSVGTLYRVMWKNYKRLTVLEEASCLWERGLLTFAPLVHEVFHVPYPLVQLRSPLGPARSD